MDMRLTIQPAGAETADQGYTFGLDAGFRGLRYFCVLTPRCSFQVEKHPRRPQGSPWFERGPDPDAPESHGYITRFGSCWFHWNTGAKDEDEIATT